DLFSWGQNVLTSFMPSAASVTGGTPVTVTATFAYEVPSAVTLVINAASDPPGSTAFLVPTRVNVPASASSVTFQVTTFFVSSPQQITLSTFYANTTWTAGFTVAP